MICLPSKSFANAWMIHFYLLKSSMTIAGETAIYVLKFYTKRDLCEELLCRNPNKNGRFSLSHDTHLACKSKCLKQRCVAVLMLTRSYSCLWWKSIWLLKFKALGRKVTNCTGVYESICEAVLQHTSTSLISDPWLPLLAVTYILLLDQCK